MIHPIDEPIVKGDESLAGGRDRYSSLIESPVYRVIQEALWSIVRYAQTDVGEVSVTTSEHQLHLIVEDKVSGLIRPLEK